MEKFILVKMERGIFGDPTSGSTGTGSFFDISAGYTYSPTFAIYGAADNMADLTLVMDILEQLL